MKWMIVLLMSGVLVLGACGDGDVENGEDNAPAEEGTSEGEDNTSENQESDMNEEDNAAEEDTNTEESQDNESSSSDNDELFHDVVSYELDIEFNNNDEWSFDYEADNNGKESEIERDGESDRDGQEAIDEIETMIEAVEPTPDLSQEEAFQRIYDHLEINQEDVSEIELEVDFSNDDYLEVEQEY